MKHEECWNNSLNKDLAIMDMATDYVPSYFDELIKPCERVESENNDYEILFAIKSSTWKGGGE